MAPPAEATVGPLGAPPPGGHGHGAILPLGGHGAILIKILWLKSKFSSLAVNCVQWHGLTQYKISYAKIDRVTRTVQASRD